MKFLNSFAIPFIWLICFLIFVWFFLNADYSKKYEHTILLSPEILKPTPIGELTAGFQVEQAINWNMLNTAKLNKSDTLCINLLFANYGDRNNTGNFSLSLHTEHLSQRIIRDAHSVHDSSYQRFCFDNLPLKDIAQEPSTLLLEGINSPSGKAVTAWMTSDTVLGKAHHDGNELDKSLIFSIDAMTESNSKRTSAVVLSVLCCLSVSALFWPTKPRQRSPGKVPADHIDTSDRNGIN